MNNWAGRVFGIFHSSSSTIRIGDDYEPPLMKDPGSLENLEFRIVVG